MELDHPPRLLPNILITGVPGCGKTTLSQLLASQLNQSINQKFSTSHVHYFKHLNVSELVKEHKLWKGFDADRNCSIFDEDKVVDFIEPIQTRGGCIIDFHSCDFFPERYFDMVILLRCDNTVLYKRLEARGYEQKKITENVESEIHGVLREEAFDSYNHDIILEAYNDKEADIQSIMLQIFEALKKLNFLQLLENGGHANFN